MPNLYHLTSKQIAAWATTKAAQNYLPKLIRLLIHAVTKPSKCDFPAGDSTSSPGWDGELYCEEDTAWTPSGQSYWELSCEAKPTNKANRDCLKRTEQTPEKTRQQSTLVSVTARKWTQKNKWLKHKLELGEWRAIRAFDAGDLEQWLEQCPAVALQFAEELEITGWEVESISKYWQSWSVQASPKITVDAFHASREASQEQLLKQLKNNFSSNQASLLNIKADSTEEAIAFVCSVLHGHDDLAAVSLVVTDPAGWRFVDKHPSLKIAIAARPEIAKTPSKRNGLTVIIPSGYSPSSNQTQNIEINVERPDIYQFEKALISLGFNEGEAHRIALNTGRSWSVYRRRFAENAAIRCPAWLNTPQANALATVCLLGSWLDSQAADKDFVSSLADRAYQEVEKDLRYLAQLDDAPVLKNW
ncbi:hypothetical protein [Methylocucumis oryzae]|uniref:Uncharacterized protein n=1 Tax=Methylocucumis oryzae TaxID=1632867 RepID=A0A0F3IHX4_9GAMM|nr:hypothetical protein [Methylocucumis oryzae]KJV05049.1 hypothetical protein VZ94_20980 [Methylocucumis oryzae]